MLAELDDAPGVVAGLAIWFPTYSTFRGQPGIWLEDLFVRPEHRGKGVCRALLDQLFERAGDGRVEWAVLDWNAPSVAFYESLGARPVEGWTIYRWLRVILRSAGVDGPYAAVLGPRCYTGVIESTEFGGYPVLEHVQLILGGPVVWGPGVDGAVVLSLRGNDFSLSCGQDLAIGYATADGSSVQLYIEESIGFRVLTPEASVPLVYAA